MDPITLEKLLSIVDAIEERREDNQLALSTFSQIIAQQTLAKDSARRGRDILRILRASGWILPTSTGALCLTQDYSEFVTAWNERDLLRINKGLAQYPPYRFFLDCLCREGAIQVPGRQDKVGRRELGRKLRDKYNITFVAFDTFRVWAVAIGQAYLSPFKETLYWGGNWDDKRPPLEIFQGTCWKSYCEAEKTSGYTNIGRLADAVCCHLGISFQAFEMKLNALVKSQPGLFILAPATIREPSRRFRIITIRPRSEVLKERLAAQLSGVKQSFEPQWLEYRYLEDGVRVNSQLVKLIRWEASS